MPLLIFHRVILRDMRHSIPEEERFYCIGRVEGGIITVRFTWRSKYDPYFWCRFWRKYRKVYLEGK